MIKKWIIKHTKSPINYGFSVGGAWKGLSVDLFFQGVAGGKRFMTSVQNGKEWKLPHMHGGQIIGHRRTQMPSSQGQEPTTELRRIDFLDSRYFIPALEECEYHLPASTTTGIQMGAFTNEILPDGNQPVPAAR